MVDSTEAEDSYSRAGGQQIIPKGGVGLRFDGGRGFVGRRRFSRNGWIKFKILNMNPKDWNIVVEAICAAPTFSKRKKPWLL